MLQSNRVQSTEVLQLDTDYSSFISIDSIFALHSAQFTDFYCSFIALIIYSAKVKQYKYIWKIIRNSLKMSKAEVL